MPDCDANAEESDGSAEPDWRRLLDGYAEPGRLADSGIASGGGERLAGFAGWGDGSCGACGSGRAGTADLLTKPTRPAASP